MDLESCFICTLRPVIHGFEVRFSTGPLEPAEIGTFLKSKRCCFKKRWVFRPTHKQRTFQTDGVFVIGEHSDSSESFGGFSVSR